MGWVLHDSFWLSRGVRCVPKGRPRFGGGRVWTPVATRDYERLLKDELCVRGVVKLEGVRVKIGLRFGKLRGDVDNYGKLFLDAFNGVLYDDDGCVDAIEFEKNCRLVNGDYIDGVFVRVYVWGDA